ncbi:MAG: hypothetical protein AAFR28_18505 [Pseudomonadota bacterium]
MKTLDNTSIAEAAKTTPDLKVFGDGDMWKLLCKASSEDEGWMKSTKVLEISSGCVVQVSTQQRNPDGSWAVAEAVTFVPGVTIVEAKESGGRKLVASDLTVE